MKFGSKEEADTLKWVVKQAKDIAGAKRVLLFGSRARGDANERSDFDIAIETNQPELVAKLQTALQENPLTLLSFDVVDLTEVTSEFRARILAEGRDISTLV